jgi:hypothetical protein
VLSLRQLCIAMLSEVRVTRADADREEIQHETALQNQAIDGISDALDDLARMGNVSGQQPAFCQIHHQAYPPMCWLVVPPLDKLPWIAVYLCRKWESR